VKRVWVNFQAELIQYLPSSVSMALGNIRHLPMYVRWWFHPEGRRRTLEILGPLRDRYQGCRCVVVGNGPSLRKVSLSRLAEEFTFGSNRIYLVDRELGFKPTYYTSINRYVIQQFAKDINEISALKFLNWSYRDSRITEGTIAYLETKPVLRPDGKLLSGYYAGAGTVTVFSMQLAYFMGFSQVILIGVDHDYGQSGTPNRAIKSKDVDLDHFSSEYFSRGVIWQLPDLPAMERGYRQIGRLFEEDGRIVLDATVGGKLQVFPKTDLDAVLADDRWMNREQFESERPRLDANRHS
jgi:hypothetical protein